MSEILYPTKFVIEPEIIQIGADRLGWDLELLMLKTIEAMKSCEARIQEEISVR